MKKLVLFLAGLFAFTALQAQWVDDPVNNNFIANCGDDNGELYTATNPITGDTYLQWEGFSSNGWSPTLQRLNFEGVPQWGNNGIHIAGHEFSSMSEGVAMTTTADGGVVSCFADYDGYTYAVKINADGTFAWGEQGLRLFEGHGFSRTELVAGTDGGFWALGADYDNSYLQYVNADGTMNPYVTISASGYKCMFGQLTLGLSNFVFVTYERLGNGFYTNKDIYLAGYDTNGVQVTPNVLLMAERTFQSTYIHYVVPDGLGGGYAYIWHPALNEAFNVYVFHYDEGGASTINDTDGIPVHSADPSNYYGSAYGTVDPITHDLIIAYEQTDASTQTQSRIYVNRITATGERVWDEGILVADNNGSNYSEIKVDAFEDGSGFSVIYKKSNSYTDEVVMAKGYDMEGNQIWDKTMSSSSYSRSVCENSTGFHMGQNIVAWVNSANGGVYGQNIGPDGTMGPIDPIIPEPDCFPPTNFDGAYVYDDEAQEYGVMLTWEAPEVMPLHYNLYRFDISVKDNIVIEVPGDATSYYDEAAMGHYKYQLTAVYEDCESEFALTLLGEDNIVIEVTGIHENANDEIVTIVNLYNMRGQRLGTLDMDELNSGVYIIQGATKDGRLVSRKVVVSKK